IRDFESTNPKIKYLSDLEVFIRESKIEDFQPIKQDCITVSTIHKAKGKEFDQVFLLLDQVPCHNDQEKRLHYVGMTRAKQYLSMYIDSPYLDDLQVENLTKEVDRYSYASPNQLAQHLTFKDVWLNYFSSRQSAIHQLQSGDILRLQGEVCFTLEGQSVLKFSKKFVQRKDELA